MEEAEYYKSLATKRISAGVIFINDERQMLIVKPTYKDGWEIPGGSVERDESPHLACQREVREELGLEIICSKILCVDWTRTEGIRSESLQFIFFGGTLSAGDIARIVLNPDELSEFKFVGVSEASQLLAGQLGKRVALAYSCLKSGEAHSVALGDGGFAL